MNFWQTVHYSVNVYNNRREKVEPQRQPEKPARNRRSARVKQVFRGNGAGGKAQGFKRAYLGALLVYHSGHGGKRHKRRHRKEEHGKDLGY